MNLTTLPTEEVQLYLHKIEGILSLLEDVSPNRLSDEASKQYKTVLEQAYVLQERFTFEIACRQLTKLHTKMETK